MDTGKKPRERIGFDEAVKRVEKIARLLKPEEKAKFAEFLEEFSSTLMEPSKEARRKLKILDEIRDELRSRLPPDALAENERNLLPSSAEFEGLTSDNTLHVDGFLYPSDDIIDEYVEKGLLARHFCTKCNSRSVKPLNFISHSMSETQIAFVFDYCLPTDLTGKTILEVGSRLGPVLYYGYLFSSAKLIGIEFNESFASLSREMLEKYKMTDRASVIHSDIRQQADLIASADVIILNNVFDAFLDSQTQKEVWKFFFASLKKSGALIVTYPSIEESLTDLDMTEEEINPGSKVNKVPIDYHLLPQEMLDEVDGYCVYKDKVEQHRSTKPTQLK